MMFLVQNKKNEKQTVQSHQEQAFSLELNSSIQEKIAYMIDL